MTPPNLDLFPLSGARIVPLDLIQPGKYQPRKHFDEKAHEEMTASVKQHGVMQPVLLIHIEGGRFELVAGERRVRAAKAAGLDAIPAVVRELTLMQVLELQAIENIQREDLHPLEEAYSYDLLMNPPDGSEGYSAAQIAERLGKDPRYVRQRLVLCKLIPQASEAFQAEQLTLQTAMAIARMPVEIQGKALPKILATRADDAKQVAHRDAARILHSVFMLQLAHAPFPIQDATLLPAAGGCNVCPKRTGAEPDLFDDVQEADTCTDPDCHALKVVAWNDRRKAEARAAGIEVIDGKAASALLKFGPDSDQLNADYVYMDQPLQELTGSTSSLKKLLGTLLKPSAMYEHPRDHTLREIVHTHKATQVLKDNGLLVKRPNKGEQAALVAPPAPAKGKQAAPSPAPATPAVTDKKDREDEAWAKAERSWRTEAFRCVHNSLHNVGYSSSTKMMRQAVIHLGSRSAGNDDLWALLCELWGWPKGAWGSGKARLADVTRQMTHDQLTILLTEVLALADLDVSPLDDPDDDPYDLLLVHACCDEDIDVDWIPMKEKAHSKKAKKAARTVQSPPDPTTLPTPAGGIKGVATKDVAGKPAPKKTKSQAPSAQTKDEGSDLPHWVGQMVKVKGAKAVGEVSELNADGSLLVAFPSGQEGTRNLKSVLRADVIVLPGQQRPQQHASFEAGQYVRWKGNKQTGVVVEVLDNGLIVVELKKELGPASAWPFPGAMKRFAPHDLELLTDAEIGALTPVEPA